MRRVIMKKNNDALVFFSFKSHKNGYIEMLFDRLVNASQEHDLKLYRGSLNDLVIEIKDNSMRIKDSMTDRDIASFGVVYFELWYKAQQQALAAARYLKRAGTPYFSEEIHNIMPVTKVGELAVLADENIPLPHTLISSNRRIKRLYEHATPINFPLIMKAADGYGGKNNFLVKDGDQLYRILNSHKTTQFVIQEFIPNECDYRCIVLGGSIEVVLKRSRDPSKDTHLNNTSAGAMGEVVSVGSLSSKAQAAVLDAARVLNRSQFAGVDLIINSVTNEPYILEVNQTPQIEIGAEVDKKMAALLSYMEALKNGK